MPVQISIRTIHQQPGIIGSDGASGRDEKAAGKQDENSHALHQRQVETDHRLDRQKNDGKVLDRVDDTGRQQMDPLVNAALRSEGQCPGV